VRFNRGRVRQPGSVDQRFLSLRLVHEQRQAAATIALGGNGEDLVQARAAITGLREALTELPEDPWLMIAETPRSTSTERRGKLAPAEAVAQQVVTSAKGCDLVGIYAAGTIYRGFANSFGQRNWHEIDSFDLDWSLHLAGDKAAKAGYAGFEWQPATFETKLESAKEQLALLAISPRTVEPGEYRAYLAPRALEELVGMICWGGFSARARATRQSALLRMEHGETLTPQIALT
jgi:predicted Zn-dependent protease